MKHSETETIEIDRLKAVTCDICQTTYSDGLEMQEFHHILTTGSYGSIFGDGTLIECDICQHCLMRLLGRYIRTEHQDERA